MKRTWFSQPVGFPSDRHHHSSREEPTMVTGASPNDANRHVTEDTSKTTCSFPFFNDVCHQSRSMPNYSATGSSSRTTSSSTDSTEITKKMSRLGCVQPLGGFLFFFSFLFFFLGFLFFQMLFFWEGIFHFFDWFCLFFDVFDCFVLAKKKQESGHLKSRAGNQ